MALRSNRPEETWRRVLKDTKAISVRRITGTPYITAYLLDISFHLNFAHVDVYSSKIS